MKLIVHPGIGDISWVLSKLSTAGEEFDLVFAQDVKTRRAMPLASMVPCVRSAVYGGMDLYEPLARTGNAKFSEYRAAAAEGKELYMTANNWLELGNRIEGYLPDLETDFHYPIHIPESDEQWADKLLEDVECSVGIYTSGLPAIQLWSAWSELEWLEFIRRVHAKRPYTTFFLIGAHWDMDMRIPMRRALNSEHIDYVDLMGKTTLPRAVALIKRLSYFAGFASGLTILADVVRTPCLMLYPDHLRKMMNTWPDPVHLANGTHTGMLWKRPMDAFSIIQSQLDKYLGM